MNDPRDVKRVESVSPGYDAGMNPGYIATVVFVGGGWGEIGATSIEGLQRKLAARGFTLRVSDQLPAGQIY